MQERRSSTRVIIQQPIALRFTQVGHYEFTGNTRDVSEGGVYLYIDRDIEPGQEVEVHITLPGNLEPFDIRGTVVRLERVEGYGTGVAIAFHHVELKPGRIVK